MAIDEILNTRGKKNIEDPKSALKTNGNSSEQTQNQINQNITKKESHEDEEIIISDDFPLDLGSL